MEVQEICRKLKPIIGKRADQYWLAYLAEDYKGKQELEIVLRLLEAKLLGSNVELPDVHLSSPPAHIAEGTYALGQVEYANTVKHPFGLREDELIQHTAIFGRSGAGKTNTVFHVIENFLNHKKPFLIFDWKRNYRDLLATRKEEIRVYTVGREITPFVFNPLIPPEGTDAAVWLKKLIEIIAGSYYLGEGVMFLLQEAIHAVYQELGVYTRTPQRYPTFNDVLKWLYDHPVKGRQALWMDSTMRGIKSVCFGHMGKVVNTGVQPNLAALLETNVILELDGLTNADKTLITQALLLWIHHYRLAQPNRETFKHAIIIEEAHHILHKQPGGRGGEAITETVLREIRELGEAIVLVDQHPSMISLPALGNTYATITMNLKHASDVSAIAAAMLMQTEEKEVLGLLPVGSAVVKLQGRWPRAFRIRVPYKNIPKGAINDARLKGIMRDKGLGLCIALPHKPSPPHEEEGTAQEPHGLSEAETLFLLDILDQPFSGVVERYRRLGLSRRKGSHLKDLCTERSLIQTVEIPTRSGRVILLELTEAGKRIARASGREVPGRSRWGSLEHEYWKHKATATLQKMGYAARMEEPVNGYTDIVAEKDGKRIAVEIETGKSDWRANILKNIKHGFPRIVILTTNEAAYQEISAATAEDYKGVPLIVQQAQDFTDYGNANTIGLLPLPD